MESVAVWVPIILSIIAAGVSVFGLVRQWHRDRPDIAETYEQMATRQAEKIKKLQDDLDILDCEVKELRRTIAEWEIGITKLITKLEEKGIPVPWIPEPPTQPRPR